jgi:hypothetical protein
MTKKVMVGVQLDPEVVARLQNVALGRGHVTRKTKRVNLSSAIKTALTIGLRELEQQRQDHGKT